MPVPSSSETSSHGMTRCSTAAPGGSVSNGPRVAPADELRPRPPLLELLVRVARDGDPLAVRAPAVLARPASRRRRRSPAASTASSSRSRATRRGGRAAGSARRATGRAAPGRRPTADSSCCESDVPQRGHHSVERWPLYSQSRSCTDFEHPPDVLDVRVAEREVVVAPVHPHAEALRSLRQSSLGRPDDDVAALAGELLEPVLLDLPLRVEPELVLDPDLDPEPLAVEAVLVALVEAAQAPCSAGRRPSASAPRRCGPPSDLFAVTGPSKKLKLGPPRLRARSCSKVPCASHHASTSSSRAGWSGLSGSGWKIGWLIGKSSVESDVLTSTETRKEP